MATNRTDLVKTLSRLFINSQKKLTQSRFYVSMLILSMDFIILVGLLARQGFKSPASLLTNAKQGIMMISLAFACIGPILVIFFSVYVLFELRIYAQIIFLHGAAKWMIKGLCVRSIIYILKPGVFISVAFMVSTIILAAAYKLALLWLYSLVFIVEIALILLGGITFLHYFITYFLYSFSRGRPKA